MKGWVEIQRKPEIPWEGGGTEEGTDERTEEGTDGRDSLIDRSEAALGKLFGGRVWFSVLLISLSLFAGGYIYLLVNFADFSDIPIFAVRWRWKSLLCQSSLMLFACLMLFCLCKGYSFSRLHLYISANSCCFDLLCVPVLFLKSLWFPWYEYLEDFPNSRQFHSCC